MEKNADYQVTAATFWSAGSLGPFPIEIVERDGSFYICALEHDDRGPFSSLNEASDAADIDFGCTDGGFWSCVEDAEDRFREMSSAD